MSNEGANTKRRALPIWYWMFMLAGAALIIRVAWEVQLSAGQKAIWLGAAALFGYVLLSGIVWRIADWLRITALPSAFLSRGFLDTLRLQVFWAVRPQFFGLLFLALAGVYVVVHWSKPIAPSVPMAQASQPQGSRSEMAVVQHDPAIPSGASGVCADPRVLASVKDEIYGALVDQARGTHHADLDVDDVRRMVRIELTAPRKNKDGPYFVECIATFDQIGSDESKRFGLEHVHDSELAYWIDRDASGNLQVSVGD